MKIAIYTLYIVTVLLFSGFARADQVAFKSPVQIVDIGVDRETLDLHVTGYVPNPCYQTPSAVLLQDAQDPTVLIVRLISPPPTQMCIQRIEGYNTIVSLRQLAQASELPLDDKALYVVKTEGYDFSIQVSGFELAN